ncbi:cytochrome b5-like heme/steroid binding domain-containing protein [Paraphoma chrysanthemicola]|uniref:Cytochrome b5-like heme/steroid binding domain-containing protein n=1 Tax=Paraphoma chrysanthemicola TaxID=798071 RepID=A0A8K0W2Q0_9PLEO|nr:cytochrome b5-like heme/steroid binding domain-containing protein [Paraphoma chrysanthemicola]
MGWMKALGDKRPDPTSLQVEVTTPSGAKDEHGRKTPEVAYVEDISQLPSPNVSSRLSHALIPPSTPNADLPFFSASAIATAVTENKLYIVIDSIVYDCSTFIHEHPGGCRVLESFRGQDCSWQFWRFHSREVMEKWSWRLRIGRTEGVKNRWAERPRWVGLRRLGDDIANW